MAAQPSWVWQANAIPQPAMIHSASFPQAHMPMAQPNSFLPNGYLPQNTMGPAAPGLRGPIDPPLPQLPGTDYLNSSQVVSSKGPLGSGQRGSSLKFSSSSQDTTPGLPSPPSFLDNLGIGSSNVLGDVEIPKNLGEDFWVFNEELVADASPPSQGANLLPAVAAPDVAAAPVTPALIAPVVAPTPAAPAPESTSEQTFDCSCCRRDKPVMMFSRDGRIPTLQNRFRVCSQCRKKKNAYSAPKEDQNSHGSQFGKPCIVCKAPCPAEGFPMVRPLCRGRSTAGGAAPQAPKGGFRGEHVFFLACNLGASRGA
ncbi:unnamed protein product [Clonostachys rosea]|uniref:Stc1 domain-containing protein n=1 Tax=Bionectria ochroleuca TaxID=29856 RepID=A0ABY6URN1_BIOOC|nr:unnamed protein product [Clonostachys rosea]